MQELIVNYEIVLPDGTRRRDTILLPCTNPLYRHFQFELRYVDEPWHSSEFRAVTLVVEMMAALCAGKMIGYNIYRDPKWKNR